MPMLANGKIKGSWFRGIAIAFRCELEAGADTSKVASSLKGLWSVDIPEEGEVEESRRICVAFVEDSGEKLVSRYIAVGRRAPWG